MTIPHDTVLAIGLLAACANAAGNGGPSPGVWTEAPAVHVQGTQLLDTAGRIVRLRGVNRSGTENAWARGWGFFDGPSDCASWQRIASGKPNGVPGLSKR